MDIFGTYYLKDNVLTGFIQYIDDIGPESRPFDIPTLKTKFTTEEVLNLTFGDCPILHIDNLKTKLDNKAEFMLYASELSYIFVNLKDLALLPVSVNYLIENSDRFYPRGLGFDHLVAIAMELGSMPTDYIEHAFYKMTDEEVEEKLYKLDYHITFVYSTNNFSDIEEEFGDMYAEYYPELHVIAVDLNRVSKATGTLLKEIQACVGSTVLYNNEWCVIETLVGDSKFGLKAINSGNRYVVTTIEIIKQNKV